MTTQRCIDAKTVRLGSKRLKKHLETNYPTQVFKLAECQEILAKTLFFADFHESQQEKNEEKVEAVSADKNSCAGAAYWNTVTEDELVGHLYAPGDTEALPLPGYFLASVVIPFVIWFRDHQDVVLTPKTFMDWASFNNMIGWARSDVFPPYLRLDLSAYFASLGFFKDFQKAPYESAIVQYQEALRDIYQRMVTRLPRAYTEAT